MLIADAKRVCSPIYLGFVISVLFSYNKSLSYFMVPAYCTLLPLAYFNTLPLAELTDLGKSLMSRD